MWRVQLLANLIYLAVLVSIILLINTNALLSLILTPCVVAGALVLLHFVFKGNTRCR